MAMSMVKKTVFLHIFRSNPPRWSPDLLPSGVLGDAFGSSPESAERFDGGAVDGRNPAPRWMVENPINNGINHLSTGAGFLPSTV